MSEADAERVWRRNLTALTAAVFIGFTGFTLVMPFLPIYISQMGVTDVGVIAAWTGVTLGVTPAMTAVFAPLWGRLADRFGRRLMVARSLFSFIIIMAAMAFATEPWHLFALRVLQGFFAGYGALCLAMAAESAPPGKLAQSIGLVQTAQRLRPGARAGDRRAGGRHRRVARDVFRDGGFLRRRVRSRAVDVHGNAGGCAGREGVGGRRGDVPQRAGLRELPAADGGDLRVPVRRPELRTDSAALHRGHGAARVSGRARVRRGVLGRRVQRCAGPSLLCAPAAEVEQPARHQPGGAAGRCGDACDGLRPQSPCRWASRRRYLASPSGPR